jgi:hypothetical protein
MSGLTWIKRVGSEDGGATDLRGDGMPAPTYGATVPGSTQHALEMECAAPVGWRQWPALR